MAFFDAARGPRSDPTAADSAVQMALGGQLQQRNTLIGANQAGGALLGQGLGTAVNTAGQQIFGTDSVFSVNTPQRRALEFTRGDFEDKVARLEEAGWSHGEATAKLTAEYRTAAEKELSTQAARKKTEAETKDIETRAGERREALDVNLEAGGLSNAMAELMLEKGRALTPEEIETTIAQHKETRAGIPAKGKAERATDKLTETEAEDATGRVTKRGDLKDRGTEATVADIEASGDIKREQAAGLKIANFIKNGTKKGELHAENMEAMVRGFAAENKIELNEQVKAAALAELNATIEKAKTSASLEIATRKLQIQRAESTLERTIKEDEAAEAIAEVTRENADEIVETELWNKTTLAQLNEAQRERIQAEVDMAEKVYLQTERQLAAEIVKANSTHNINAQRNTIEAARTMATQFQHIMAPLNEYMEEMRKDKNFLTKAGIDPVDMQKYLAEGIRAAVEGLKNSVGKLRKMNDIAYGADEIQNPVPRTGGAEGGEEGQGADLDAARKRIEEARGGR